MSEKDIKEEKETAQEIEIEVEENNKEVAGQEVNK